MFADPAALPVVGVVFLATLVRSTFGFGEALVAVPLLALVIPVRIAVPLAILLSVTVAALILLQERGVQVEAVSSVYATEPVGEILDQPDFLNAAVRIRTELGPEPLLDVCKAVEAERGRVFDLPRHSPRPLDVDLLLLGDLVLNSDRLKLPHPEVRSRRFVIVPLLELDPGLALPDGTRLADALAVLPEDEQRVERVAGVEL